MQSERTDLKKDRCQKSESLLIPQHYMHITVLIFFSENERMIFLSRQRVTKTYTCIRLEITLFENTPATQSCDPVPQGALLRWQRRPLQPPKPKRPATSPPRRLVRGRRPAAVLHPCLLSHAPGGQSTLVLGRLLFPSRALSVSDVLFPRRVKEEKWGDKMVGAGPFIPRGIVDE